MNPITGIARCCARAASGHAMVAPPSAVMKSRRLNRLIRMCAHRFEDCTAAYQKWLIAIEGTLFAVRQETRGALVQAAAACSAVSRPLSEVPPGGFAGRDHRCI
jgi:hypothetical protein